MLVSSPCWIITYQPYGPVPSAAPVTVPPRDALTGSPIFPTISRPRWFGLKSVEMIPTSGQMNEPIGVVSGTRTLAVKGAGAGCTDFGAAEIGGALEDTIDGAVDWETGLILSRLARITPGTTSS